jgi:hypothetical protein
MKDRLKGTRLKRQIRRRRLFRAPRPSFVGEPLPCPVSASEAGGATAAAAPTAPAVTTSLATLLTRHILRDGEIVLLICRPSLWSIFFATLPFAAIGLILVMSVKLWAPHGLHIAVEAALMLVTCRAAWAVLTWMGRLYLLTDLRVVRIAGVFNPQIHDCPLRKVARTRLVTSTRERLWRLGSMEIIPENDQYPSQVWQIIRRPVEVHETVRRAVARAKQGGCFGNGW